MHSITQEAKDTLIGAMNEYFSKPAQVKFSSQSELEDAIAYDVVALIKQIPVSDGWIPVSERLPEDCETVIATD